jgi:hypothetical protein
MNPSASRFARPSTTTTLYERPSQTAPATIAKVVYGATDRAVDEVTDVAVIVTTGEEITNRLWRVMRLNWEVGARRAARRGNMAAC